MCEAFCEIIGTIVTEAYHKKEWKGGDGGREITREGWWSWRNIFLKT